MRRLRFLLLALPWFAAAVGCEETPAAISPVSPVVDPQAWNVLVDFDNYPRPPTLDDPALDAKIIEPIVRGPFVKKQEDCKAQGAHAVARLTGGYAGAFTAKGRDERLYLVHAHECEGEQHEKHHLVIFAGDKVMVDVEIAEQMVAEVRDVDQDGDNEILLIGAQSEGGTLRMTARMVDTEDGHFETLFDFKEIAKSTCPKRHLGVAAREIQGRRHPHGLRGREANPPLQAGKHASLTLVSAAAFLALSLPVWLLAIAGEMPWLK